jgi:hypothetical protein
MISEVLKKIQGAINAVLAGTKLKVKIKTPFFEAELDGSALVALQTALQADHDNFGIIFDRCFTRRDLYVVSFENESLDDVQASATEIRNLLDAHVDALSGRGGDTGTLLMAWAASAKRLGAVLYRQLKTLPPGTRVSADPPSADALMSFRTETLPIIGLLICQLKDLTRDRAEGQYSNATKLLTGHKVVVVGDAVKAA